MKSTCLQAVSRPRKLDAVYTQALLLRMIEKVQSFPEHIHAGSVLQSWYSKIPDLRQAYCQRKPWRLPNSHIWHTCISKCFQPLCPCGAPSRDKRMNKPTFSKSSYIHIQLYRAAIPEHACGRLTNVDWLGWIHCSSIRLKSLIAG